MAAEVAPPPAHGESAPVSKPPLPIPCQAVGVVVGRGVGVADGRGVGVGVAVGPGVGDRLGVGVAVGRGVGVGVGAVTAPPTVTSSKTV